MTLLEQNKKRWDNCHVYDARGPLFKKVADRILANKATYQTIEKATGVPWWFVGITHYRESNLNFNTQLAQGDPLSHVSTHVPKGRGPFSSFKDGAIDALVKCPPYAARNKDWSIAGALTMFEKYNGLGYANMGRPSPYVWAGTDQYVSGKYVRDNVYDPNAVDSQLGCAGLMKYLGVGQTGLTKPLGGAVVAGGALSSTMWDKVLAHPYIAVGATLMVFAAVVLVVNYFNRKKTVDVTDGETILPDDLGPDSRLGKADMAD